MLLWVRDVLDVAPVIDGARSGGADLLIGEGGPVEVSGALLEAGDAAEMLAGASVGAATGTLTVWSRAAGVLHEMLARGRFVPVSRPTEDEEVLSLRWEPLLDQLEDRRRRLLLARAMPLAAHCGAPATPALRTLDCFWRDATDSLVRRASTQPPLTSGWEADLVEHLQMYGRSEWRAPSPSLREAVLAWLAPPVPPETWTGRLVLGDPPAHPDGAWLVHLEVVADDDPDRRVGAAHVWSGRDRSRCDALRRALRAASHVSPAIGAAEREPAPTQLVLDTAGAHAFLVAARRGGLQGVELVVPDALDTSATAAALRLRLHAGSDDGDVAAPSRAPLGEMLADTSLAELTWQATLQGRLIDDMDLDVLRRTSQGLVFLAGRWVTFDPVELDLLRRHLSAGPPPLAAGEVVAAVLAGELDVDDATSVDVVAGAELSHLARALQGRTLVEAPAPHGFVGELRPYQARGLDWLTWLGSERLGGCLADDMGLGKTVVALALVLADPGPTLVVCPASVLGNWQHETARFAPALARVAHHGPDRAETGAALEAVWGANTIVFTTYAILRRDVDLLASHPWHRVVLDEAQHMKNPQSDTARAARAVGAAATHRLALTGTPLENRLQDLWSILDFCNPGLLGTQASFRARFAVPVERRRDGTAAARLRRIAAPFVLRRRKSDPDVVAGLPAKHETTAFCGLSVAQADLYRSAVDDAMAGIRDSDGIGRRGRVLALLTRLKQICDHPWLVAPGVAGDRIELSAKLALLVELVDEVRAAGDRSLVFTQYVRMGAMLSQVFGGAPFLHGGVPLGRRDDMVRSFQTGAGHDVLVVSLRAGGVGLNLAAASRVFHYDRWWNPAVEDQATDRAHRIGQTRDVWVHRLVCMGTLEEHVDALLERKRELTRSVLAEGESFLTEMSDDELAALVALEEAALP